MHSIPTITSRLLCGLVMRCLQIILFALPYKDSDKTAAQDDTDVKAAVDKVAESLGNDGRILVRESGTEPVVRVMVEAGTHEECEKYVDDVIAVIKEKGYAVE